MLSSVMAAQTEAQTSGHRLAVPEARLGHWEDRIRLVVETGNRLPWQRFDSEHTDNIVVPLDGLDARSLRRAMATAITLPHPLIRDYHLNGDRHMPRLVLSLRRPARVHVFVLRPMDGHAHRLVLDMFPLDGGETDRSRESAVFSHGTAGTASTGVSGSETQELWLAARVNHRPDVRTVLALRQEDAIWLSRTDLERWNIHVPSAATTRRWAGEEYVGLSGTGINAALDTQTLTLALEVPVNMLSRTHLGRVSEMEVAPTPSPLGAFFNYDVSITRDDRDDQVRRDGFFELGVFNGWGSGTSSTLVRDEADSREVIRLETAWRQDNPAKMRSLILGDTINGGTSWSGAVRFGGLHWGTNFSTRPELITMPMLSLSGDAAVPSTVDLYVNDALRLREEVSAGPFSIDEIPTVTGTGEMRMVVRDIFGREQVVIRDFYGSPALLRAGLQEWSLDIGNLREQYGVRSTDYGSGMFAGTWRRGVSDLFTVEAHAQTTGTHHMGGLGFRWKTPFPGTLAVSGAASDGDAGAGSLAAVGIQHQGRRFSAGLESQYASEAFRRLGVNAANPLPEVQHRAHAGVGHSWVGSTSLGYTSQQYHDGDHIEFVTLSFSRNLGALAHLGFTAFHFPDTYETGLQAMLTVPLGTGRTTASVGGNARFGGSSEDTGSGSAQIQRSLPAGTGFGYRLRTGIGNDEFDQAVLSYQSNVGTWALEGSRNDDATAMRANARGGIAVLDGNVLASRYIDQSFAVVDMGDFSDVRIFADNQEVARSNRHGAALIPRLRAYERNRISAHQADLPLGVSIDQLEQTVAPYHRSGVVIRFDAKRSRNALFRLMKNGQELPAGAVVTDQHGKTFPVGLDGQVYVTGLGATNSLRAEWMGGRCTFELNMGELDDAPYAEPGDISCTD